MSFRARSVGTAKINETQRVVLDHDQLRGADFSGRKLVQFSVAGSRLEACRFDRTKIESGSFGAGRSPSEYVECSFDGARIRFGPGGYARFVRCSFHEADLSDWFCFTVELVECTFSGRLRKAFFNGTTPEDKRAVVGRDCNEFRGNDFSGMDLVDVAFRTGIDLTEQRLPTRPEYLFLPEAPTAIEHARAQVVGWGDVDLRQPAMALIKSLEEELQGGQRQLLLRADVYSSLRREAVDAVFSLLRSVAA